MCYGSQKFSYCLFCGFCEINLRNYLFCPLCCLTISEKDFYSPIICCNKDCNNIISPCFIGLNSGENILTPCCCCFNHCDNLITPFCCSFNKFRHVITPCCCSVNNNDVIISPLLIKHKENCFSSCYCECLYNQKNDHLQSYVTCCYCHFEEKISHKKCLISPFYCYCPVKDKEYIKGNTNNETLDRYILEQKLRQSQDLFIRDTYGRNLEILRSPPSQTMTDDSIKERMENEYTDLLIEYFKKSNESLFDVNLVNLVKSYNKENDYIVIRSMYDFARYRNSIVLK